MFSSKKPVARVSTHSFSSLIADNLALNGDLEFDGGLKVSGRVRGSVCQRPGSVGSLLALSAGGTIEGDIRSHDALIDGTVVGDLYVDNVLELHSNARVRGNISYRQLSMETGAVVEGRLIRLDEQGALLELPQPCAEAS